MELAQEIDEYLNKKERPSKVRDYFYVSEVTKSKKQIWESLKNQKEVKFDARVKRILENGDYMHMRYYKYFAEMGILRAAEVTAVENELFHGRADCLVSDKSGKLWLIDLKSCSQWTFNKLKEVELGHKMQLLFYMYYMNIDGGMILYENKDNQNIKIFKIMMTKENKELVESYVEKFKEFKKEIDSGIVPKDEPVIPINMEDIQYGD